MAKLVAVGVPDIENSKVPLVPEGAPSALVRLERVNFLLSDEST
jgi:hypothetical protein